MIIAKIIKNFPVLLLVLAIAFSPSINFGRLNTGKIIEIRLEDILILIFSIACIFYFIKNRRTKIEKPPLFIPMFFWSLLAIATILANWLLLNLRFEQSFFYFLKEIEIFFFYFFIYLQLKGKSVDLIMFVTKIFIYAGFINILYVIYQIVSGHQKGEYGIAAISEKGVFPTGAFFLFFFIFALNIFLYSCSEWKKERFVFLIAGLSFSLGVFGSASKTNFLALLFSLLITFLLLFLKKPEKKHIIWGAAIIAVSAVIFIFAIQKVNFADRLTPMFSPSYIIKNFDRGRFYLIKPEIEYLINNPAVMIFGHGTGFFTEAHNQYVRSITETGLLGTFLFFYMLWYILKTGFEKYSTSDGFVKGMGAGIFISTLAMLFLCIGTDPFFVVKPASVYWSFCAMAMAAFYSYNKKNAALPR